MEILNNEKNLATFLHDISKREVIIISAFASGTENIVAQLLKNENKLELLVGTINSFSSPDFFEYCKKIENNHFSLSVDFGYQNSIHWKLYLIKPATVIIGSANFTNTGLSLVRDTCVVIEDKALLEQYMKEFAAIKSSPHVVSCRDNNFMMNLKKYRDSHRRMQAGRARSVKAGNGEEWLTEEENQLIPVFIWDSTQTKDTVEEAHNLLKEESHEEHIPVLRDFFTYQGTTLPYSQGDLVLCMKSNGSYADFYSFDRIIHKGGFYYIYSYRQKHYIRPFRISKEIKSEIKNRVEDWYDSGRTELDRSTIQDLIKSANKTL